MNIPTLNNTKRYLWNYKKTIFLIEEFDTEGNIIKKEEIDDSEPIIIGVYGEDGNGIVSITNYYNVTSDIIYPSTWEASPPAMTDTKKYLWSYEEIVYTNICAKPGSLGQPWILMSPKLNQNIFLACYDNPMTLEELSIEIGVALPYMEDTVNHLINQTLLIKKGNKYETNFPIISKSTQQKIHLFFDKYFGKTIGDRIFNTINYLFLVWWMISFNGVNIIYIAITLVRSSRQSLPVVSSGEYPQRLTADCDARHAHSAYHIVRRAIPAERLT